MHPNRTLRARSRLRRGILAGSLVLILGGASFAALGPASAGIRPDKEGVPEKAPCSVCIAQGEDHGAEKVEATSSYQGRTYTFCSEGCQERFDEDPLAYIPIDAPRPAPDFAVRTPTGKTVGLADYKGRWLLLDFWATWCKPCTKLMPEIDTLAERYAERGLAVLGVTIDENAEKAFSWAQKKGFAYAIAADDPAAPAWAAYRVKVIPTAFLINPDGEIVARWMGKWDHEELEAKLEAVLPS